jgi:UDP-glucose 4-epimerase
MTRILVTGGAGFIGSHLVDALLGAGNEVCVLDDLSTGRRTNLNARAELVVGDVADASLLRELARGTSCIFHLAAIASVQRSNEDWLGTHRVNQTGSITVFEASRAAGRIPVVNASSAAVYGGQGGGPVDEDAPLKPQTAYGVDKLGSELHALVATSIHGVPTLGLRFFNVYGPRQDPSSPYSGVISIFAARIARGEPITVHGTGEQVRDFVFIGDVVAHLLAASRVLQRRSVVPRALNVCSGRPTSIIGLAQGLCEVTGHAVKILHGPSRVGDIPISLGNPSRAIAELGVSTDISLHAGLRLTAGTA